MYLRAAAQTLPGDPVHGAFHYTKQVLSGDVAVLEVETTVEGKFVNGGDIIRCDDTGRIVEFRVMIRPLQAINAALAIGVGRAVVGLFRGTRGTGVACRRLLLDPTAGQLNTGPRLLLKRAGPDDAGAAARRPR